MARTFGGLTLAEELVLDAIADGTYFVYDETPSGVQDGSNATFTLATSPNPASSLALKKNGQYLVGGGVDYTLSGSTITYVAIQIPFASDVVRVSYTVSPV